MTDYDAFFASDFHFDAIKYLENRQKDRRKRLINDTYSNPCFEFDVKSEFIEKKNKIEKNKVVIE